MSKNELEIDRLKAVDKELAQADAEFEHQQRRYNDQMERNGGHDWGFGEDLKRIIQNRQSIAKERAEIATKLGKFYLLCDGSKVRRIKCVEL